MGDPNSDNKAAFNPTAAVGAAGSPSSPRGGGIFFRSKLRSALTSSNDIFSSISNRLSLLSQASTSSHTSDVPPPQLPTTPPEQQQTLATREWVEGACAVTVECEADVPGTPESRNSLAMNRLKVI